MFNFYQTLIDEHRETLDLENARDLIDVYLIEIEKAKLEGKAGELFEGRDHGKLLIKLLDRSIELVDIDGVLFLTTEHRE